ncbi:helix-turn-helix domain-containing protein [Leucobacter luti]|uniref:Transcriptional regulator with XRE-family HTH domain n=1 Tax=Leucobacter luti TaxID=340320 RepID=A0A4Q7TN41_9MICO|nr:helix-turn-helix transcriptional regulator [Leucobacter luti]RZT61120.1 transcriptional regulator with XRE-family HTH domain [Leucobacter luti]
MTSETSKRDLGRFVTARRRAAGLTQRELATRLHVTESAVSKWERGLSYPDITMVQALSAELGVSVHELIHASEDHEGRADRRDARAYRGWRAAILWSTAGAYALALLTSFIVNLSVSHTLDWFWVVLPAVTLAASLTTLPLLRIPRAGWWSLLGAIVSLAVLLLVVWAQHGGGTWIWIALAGVIFGALLVFTPILLRAAGLPAPLRRHVTLITLVILTVALALLLGVIALAVGRPELWAERMLPLAAIGAAPVWLGALILRYVPGPIAARGALVSLLAGASTILLGWGVDRVLGDPWEWAPDLGVWTEHTVEANVLLLVVLCAVGVALWLGVAALVGAKRQDSALDTALETEVD